MSEDESWHRISLPSGWGKRHSLSLLRGCTGYYHYNGAWRAYELRAGDELQVLEKIDDTVVVYSGMGPLYARQMFVNADNLGMASSGRNLT